MRYDYCQRCYSNPVTRVVSNRPTGFTKAPEQQTCGCSWFESKPNPSGLCDACTKREEDLWRMPPRGPVLNPEGVI